MDWDRLVAMAQNTTREELFVRIDVEVVREPGLALAANRCKAVLDHVYAAAAEGGELAAQMGEVFMKVAGE